MRHAPTLLEELLWKVLRNRRLEHLKFRRQVPIGRYVVDFLCPRHRLIVEADGPFHDPEQDAIRDAWLLSQGFRVLRFPNSTVSNRPNEVTVAILKATATPTTNEYDAPADRWALDTGAPLPLPTCRLNRLRAADPVIDPSSGASRHLLPQGEKG
ncbi:MAG: endonuclease domain-containing protein [Caulobacter sp.]|nr:endonuclease domain-containing protein [Caulobacter sp.]